MSYSRGPRGRCLRRLFSIFSVSVPNKMVWHVSFFGAKCYNILFLQVIFVTFLLDKNVCVWFCLCAVAPVECHSFVLRLGLAFFKCDFFLHFCRGRSVTLGFVCNLEDLCDYTPPGGSGTWWYSTKHYGTGWGSAMDHWFPSVNVFAVVFLGRV